MSAITLTITSCKGGVGKSTIAMNMAVALAAAGYFVLVVDLDSRTGLSVDFGLRGTVQDDGGAGLVEALASMTIPPVLQGVRENLDVIVGGREIARVRDLTAGWAELGLHPYEALDRILGPLKNSYDLIIVDSAPSDEQLRALAFAASDYVVIPTKSDRASILGIAETADAFALVRDYNSHVSLAGVVLFGINPSATAIQAKKRAEIEAALSGIAPVFNQAIRHQEGSAVAARDVGLSIAEYEQQVLKNAPAPYTEEGRKLRLARSAPGLASDLHMLTVEIMSRLQEMRAERRLETGKVAHA